MQRKKGVNILFLGKEIYSKLSKKSKKDLKLVQFSLILNSVSEILSLSLIIPFLSILSNPEEITNIGILKYLFPEFIIESNIKTAITITFLFIFCTLISGLIRIGNIILLNKVAAKLSSEISCNLYSTYINKDYEDFIQFDTSEKINYLTALTEKTLVVITASLQLITCAIISLSIYSTLIFFNWKIAILIGVIFSTIYLLLGKLIKRKYSENSRIFLTKSKKHIKTIREGFGSIRDIHMNQSQSFYNNIYREIDSQMRNIVSQIKYISNTPKYVIEAFGLSFLAAIGCILSLTSTNPTRVIEFLGLFGLGVQKLLPYLQQIFANWSNIQSYGNSALEVVREIDLNIINKSKYFNKTNKKDLSFKTLEMKNVFYKYPNSKEYTIKNINLKVSKGDLIGIKGKSGYGKSTLIDLIMCLIKPTKGEILLNGTNLYEDNLFYKWRKIISHVPQNIYLADKSIMENIAISNSKDDIDFEKIMFSSKIAQVYDFIKEKENGFEIITGEDGTRLSGGQKQRIGIARAIYKSSELLILDEGTSSLDHVNEKEILKNIFTMQNNKTIIMISHRLSTLKDCDYIIELKKDGSVQVTNQKI